MSKSDAPDENMILQSRMDGLLNSIERVEDTLEGLQSTVTELEARVDSVEDRAPDPSRLDYEQMDRGDKVTVVRSKLRAEANATNGTAKAGYKDVIRMFDGHPSAGHAYQLMDEAGSGDGFSYNESPDGSKRVTYNVKQDGSSSRRE